MAIYHLSAQVISRGYGHSAVHAAAYRARCEIADSRTGLVHDYGRKAGELMFEGIYAPKDAPEWARDRAQLWNHVEAFEKHRRAELAREFVIALPHELTLDQGRYAIQDWVRENFTRKGLIADVTIHAPGREGDERNVHAHVMVVTRKLDGTEFIRTKERFDTYSEKAEAKKAELETLRESWARIGNRHLERHGFEASLDHRTLEAQGIEREPTIHMGKAATAIEREGTASELGDVNREIAADNERRVIDLAAERTMREAHAAARGQVEDVRPPERGASIDLAAALDRDDSILAEFTAAARETAQAREAAAAASTPEPELSPSTAHEPAPEIRNTGDIAGGLADGAARLFGKALDFVGGLFEGLFAGPSTPSKEPPALKSEPERAAQPDPDAAFREWVRQHQQQQTQQEAERRAAQERETAAREAAEKDARLQELLEQIRRDNQRRRYDRDTGREIDDDRDYDRGRERER